MRTKICYEWDLETTDENGDVLDHHHAGSAYALLWARKHWGEPDNPGHIYRLVLVRDEHESWGGEPGSLLDRDWAYVNGQTLPQCFSAPGPKGMIEMPNLKVPKRFHTELERAWVWLGEGRKPTSTQLAK